MMRLATVLCLTAVFIAAVATARSEDGPVTFSKDVAPILYANCVDCHRPGQIGPFSLMDYESARPWAKSIKESVANKTMPPFHADTSLMAYKNDLSLTDEEIAAVVAWVDQGAVRGNPAEAPEPPVFHDDWTMGQPDMIFASKTEFLVPAGQEEIEYQAVVFDVNLTEDLYITEWEIKPRHRNLVHHANLVRTMRDPETLTATNLVSDAVVAGGDYIGSYLPGCRPMKYPEGTAYRLPKGSNLAIQVHYVGGKEDALDAIEFGVKFAEGRVDKLVRVVGTDDREIHIPPHDPSWEMIGAVQVMYDMYALSSGAHMHLRGKDYLMEAVLPDGTRKLITSVPNYDFNWQTNYLLAEPVFMPKGSIVHTTAHWDNSEANPHNPDPTAWVENGPWTTDEMLNSWTHVILAEENLGLKIEEGRLAGKFEDAQTAPHPFLIQSLPGAKQFHRPITGEDVSISAAD